MIKHIANLFSSAKVRSQIGKNIIYFSDSTFAQSLSISWEALNVLLASDIVAYPRLRVINKRNPYTRGYAGFMGYGTTEEGDVIPTVRPKRLVQALHDGCTLILDRCHSYFPCIDILRRSLSENLKCQVSANLYASWTQEPGFGLHFDDHDVIALQISGSKQWAFHEPTLENPMSWQKSFKEDAPSTPPCKLITLNPGQMVYVPRGYWHDVKTLTAPSLHVSFAIPRPRYHDIAKIMLETMLTKPLFRKSLPLESNALELDEIQTELLKLFSKNDFGDWAHALQCSAVPRQLGFQLPKLTLAEPAHG